VAFAQPVVDTNGAQETSESPASPTPAPSPAPSPIAGTGADSAAVAITPESAPKRVDDVSPLREKLQDRLAGLEKYRVGEDATPAQQAVAKAAATLRDTFEAALTQLEAFEAAHRTAVELGSAQFIAARNAQLEEYRGRTQELKEARPAGWSEARRARQRDDARTELERISAQTEVAVKQQAARQAAINAYPQEEQEAAKRLADARQALSAALKRTAPSPSPAPSPPADVALDAETLKTIRTLELRNLAWQVFLADLRIEQLAVDKVVLNLESAAADATIPVLQAYNKVLADFRGALERDSARDQREQIARELESAQTPHRKAYWEVRHAIAEGRRVFGTQVRELRERLEEIGEAEWVADARRTAKRYERLLERLDRTTGAEKTAAYRQLTQRLQDFASRREDTATELDEARRRLEHMHEQRDEVLDVLKDALERLRETIQGIETAAEREEFDRMMAELASEHRPSLESVMTDVIAQQVTVIGQLAEQLAQLDGFYTKLLGTQQGLFWAYTLARGPNLLATWQTAIRTFDLDDVARSWSRARTGTSQRIEERGLAITVVWSLALVLAIAMGIRLSHRFWRAGDAHEEKITAELAESEAGEVHLNDRVRIQLSRMFAMVLPAGLPATLLLVYFWQDEVLPTEMRLMLIRLTLVILLATVTRALIKRLFRAGKPRFRIIPCSNVVANYYRFWLSTLWWITMPIIPAVMFMRMFDLAPGLADAIHTTYVSAALLVLFLFARNRQTVMRVVGRAWAIRRPILFGFLVQVYPLVLLLLVVLFALEVMGHDALVDFVARNLLHTFGAIALASLLSGMLSDFVRRHTAPQTPAEEGAASQPEAPKEHGIDEMLRQFRSRELGLVLSTGATMCRWVIWLGSLTWIAVAWGMTEQTARRIFAFELVSPPVESGALPISVGRVLLGIFVVYAAFKISKLVCRTLSEKVYPAYGQFDKGAQATINTLLHYTLITVGFYIGLRTVHIELGALAVLFGGLGLGLGLGLQPLIVNFVSGLILFAERHVKVGDLVMVGDELGEVAGISMRSTLIRSVDGIDLVIPNSEFVTSKVVNWTLQDSKIRGQLKVGVAYGSDVQKVRSVLLEVAHKEPRVLFDPEPRVWFTEFGESSLNFTLACWYPTAGDRWFAMIDMRYEVDRRFREEGIEIPFPQRTLSIKPGEELPIRLVEGKATLAAGPGGGADDKPKPEA
jgi:small-conductance mechanosensitive channel